MYIQKVTIDNDNEAEDWIQQIKDSEAERDRLVSVCDYEIDKYQNLKMIYEQQHADNIKDVMTMLGEYCRLQASRTTKTLTTHKLPSGTLKWVHKAPSVVRDDSKLLAWLDANAKHFIKTTVSVKPDWESLKSVLSEQYKTQKKELTDHYEYVTIDGEIIPVDGVTLVPQADVFEIK
jgi:phage host-nuclease inhibitor protein Gam